ncbi:unnamed protein product [Paramecium sonneborni]|uniref:Protein kinase domain-containing protein n=1 Tax=Paramecium sonneborni TaxID=65129 RepID=A0A8S1MJD7_9CILI|nr:unnamed protein product [Paramecium sonneborni]
MKRELKKEEFNQKYKPFQQKSSKIFTTNSISQINKDQFWIKKRKIGGKYQDQFQQDIRKEIQNQYKFAEKYPNQALRISDFTTYKKKQFFIVIKIAYFYGDSCQPILCYAKQNCQDDEKGLKQKINLSLKLLEIQKTLSQWEISHLNIKPNNLLYFEDDILLTDFGSNRTFYQNYIKQFSAQKEKIWQQEYCQYNPKAVLEILDDIDYLREVQLNELRVKMTQAKKSKKIEDTLCDSYLDSWAIGVIIIQIFFPEEILKGEINIKSCLAMNIEKLDEKIKIIKEIDSNIGTELKELFYPTYEYSQKQDNKIIFQSSLMIDKDIGNKLKIEQKDEVIEPIVPIIPLENIDSKTIFIHHELVSSLNKSMLLLKGQKISVLKDFLAENALDKKIYRVLDFHELLQLDLCDIKLYLEELQKICNQYEEKIQVLIKNNIFLAENRQKALEYYFNIHQELPEPNIIYYYNKLELYMISQMEQFQIKFETESKLLLPYFSSEMIKQLKKLRKKEIKIDANFNINLQDQEQKITSIYYLDKNNNPHHTEILEIKQREKKIYGFEIFPFNLSLKTRFKVREFIQFKKPECLLQQEEYDSITTKVQREYLNVLYSCLDDNQRDISKYLKAINEIFPKVKQVDKRKYFKVYIQQDMLPKELDPQISDFLQQNFGYLMKINRKYKEYLKQFEDFQITSKYNGFLVNKKCHGLGFRQINENFIQFGIFKYGQLLWGWELVKKEQRIYLYKGQFDNNKKQGDGVLKVFFPQLIKKVNYYRLMLKSKGYFQDDQQVNFGQEIDYEQGFSYNGEFQNSKKEGYGQKIALQENRKDKYIQYRGTFVNNLEHGKGKWLNQDKTERDVEFRNGKLITQ